MANEENNKEFEERLRKGKEALDRSREVQSARKSIDESHPSASPSDATTQLLSQSSEAFALNQKIQADVHNLFVRRMAEDLETRGTPGRSISTILPATGTNQAGRADVAPRAEAAGTPPEPATVENLLRGESVRTDVIEKPAEPQGEADRSAIVDKFLHECNAETNGGFKVIRRHLWLAAGHARARQFELWQQGSDKATGNDDKSFRRILGMPPADFIALLAKKGIFGLRS